MTFIAGAQVYECDIRRSTSVRLSPRSSFAQFLKEVGALADGQLQVTRTAERE